MSFARHHASALRQHLRCLCDPELSYAQTVALNRGLGGRGQTLPLRLGKKVFFSLSPNAHIEISPEGGLLFGAR